MIPAGGSGKLVAKVHTHAQQNGKISKMIRVYTDDPGLKELVLHIDATVIAPIVVHPTARIWLNTWEDTPAETELLLHRQDGKPLKIEDTHIEPPGLVKLVWAPVKVRKKLHGIWAGPGDVVMKAQIPGPPHAMSRSGKVELTTNDPREKTFVLPLFVQVRPTLEPIPPRLRFILGQRGPKEYWRILELRAHSAKRFQIRSVETDRPDLFKVVIMPPRLGTSQRIRVGLDREAALKVVTKKPLSATMTVKTDDAKHPVIVIPVIVRPVQPVRPVRLPPKVRLLRPKKAPAVKKEVRDPRLPPPGSGPVF